MKKRDSKKRRISLDQNGFTLVEMIVTICILAFITVPILSYFSNAAKHNARSRKSQNATVAAQDMLEQLKNMKGDISNQTDFAKADTAGEWTTSVNGTDLECTRTFTVDKSTFSIKAVITPVNSYQRATRDAAGNINTSTQSYSDYTLGSLDPKTDVVATEPTNIENTAALYFYGLSQKAGGTTLTMDIARKNLKRTILVEAAPSASKAGYAVYKVSYKYELNNGASYPGITTGSNYTQMVESTTIKDENISNIYLFYNPLAADHMYQNDLVDVKFDTALTSKADFAKKNGKVRLYLVGQNSVANGVTAPTGYTNRASTYKVQVKVDAGLAAKMKDPTTNKTTFKTNLTSGEFTSSDVTPDYEKLVDQDSANRVADITVTVTDSDGKEITSVSGSKYQN